MTISEELSAIMGCARDEAHRTGCYEVLPEHLLLGILRHGGSAASEALKAAGADAAQIKETLDGRVFRREAIPWSRSGEIRFSRQAGNVLSIAMVEAWKCGAEQAAGIHLLVALARSVGNGCAEVLSSKGITGDSLTVWMKENGLAEAPKEGVTPVKAEEMFEELSARLPQFVFRIPDGGICS